MKSSILTKIILGAAVVFSASCISISVLSSRRPETVTRTLITNGNQCLNDLQYESAITQFKTVLTTDPKNTEAIQGILEASYRMGNKDSVREYLVYYWQQTVNDPEFTALNESTLLKMTEVSETFFEKTEDYTAFLGNLYETTGNEKLARLKADANSAVIAAQIDAEDYEAACALLENSGEYADTLAKLYRIRGLQAWQDKNLNSATELLENAFSHAEENSALQEELAKDIESCVIECFGDSRYDEAGELIALAQKFCGDSCLQEYSSVLEVRSALRKTTGELDKAFQANDLDAVTQIMNSGEFWDCAGKAGNVFYSDSLMKGALPTDTSTGGISADALPEGEGTAVYLIDGLPCVYYGEYKNGMRQGKGLWCLTSGEEDLYKYTLEWKDDLPNGEGKLESFETLVNRDQNGEETGTETIRTEMTFQCVNGVMDGECVQHCEIIAEETYTFDMTIKLENGYSVPLGKKDYPAATIDARNDGEPIVAYAVIKREKTDAGQNETYVWRNYSTEAYTIAGFENHISKASAGEKDL